jgi:hypothetical protein
MLDLLWKALGQADDKLGPDLYRADLGGGNMRRHCLFPRVIGG